MGEWVSWVAKQQINYCLTSLHRGSGILILKQLQLLPNKYSQQSLFNLSLWLSSEPPEEEK